jgi:hypothetical protein
MGEVGFVARGLDLCSLLYFDDGDGKNRIQYANGREGLLPIDLHFWHSPKSFLDHEDGRHFAF